MGIMIRDKEIERLQTELENIKRLYDYSMTENTRLREKVESLENQRNNTIRELKADIGILERTIDHYVREIAELRAKK